MWWWNWGICSLSPDTTVLWHHKPVTPPVVFRPNQYLGTKFGVGGGNNCSSSLQTFQSRSFRNNLALCSPCFAFSPHQRNRTIILQSLEAMPWQPLTPSSHKWDVRAFKACKLPYPEQLFCSVFPIVSSGNILYCTQPHATIYVERAVAGTWAVKSRAEAQN